MALATMRQHRRLLRLFLCCCAAVAACCLWRQQLLSNWKEAEKPDPMEAPCLAMLRGERSATEAAVADSKKRPLPEDFASDEQFANSSCRQLLRGFWRRGVSRQERDFPLAFAVVAFKDFYQLRLLLQAVHRSHNAYCVHVDSKSAPAFKRAVIKLAGCLGNVALQESHVVWGKFSVLRAQILCFSELLRWHSSWKYVINLTGQEFPIRTLKEMTVILASFNGSNCIKRMDASMYKRQYPAFKSSSSSSNLSGLRWYKGSLLAMISRPAVSYMLHDPRGVAIYRHIERHYADGGTGYFQVVPDETYFATLNHNFELLRFPGSYTGRLFTDDGKNAQIFRFKIWSRSCLSGLSVRGICILGVTDLQKIDKSLRFVANKFYFSHQPMALQCMRWRFWHNTRADYDPRQRKTFAATPSQYANYDFVLHHA